MKLPFTLIMWLCLSICAHSSVYAQDDLMDLLEDISDEPTVNYTFATFKTVRIMNSHSVEMSAPGVLTMNIAHRFGRINGGAYEFFGLDQANMRLGFQYGLAPWLSVGIGRSNVFKTYDGFVKLKFLRQQTGARTIPVSAAYVGGLQLNSLRWVDTTRENLFSSRLSYTHQLLIARKFSQRLSLQLMPTMVHRNLVSTTQEQNDVFAIGAGGRIKLLPSLTLNAEYYYLLPGHTADNFQNALSIGVDIETGGHVFQLIFSNSRAMTENLFVAATDGRWSAGDIHFGFNLTRVFTVQKPKIPTE